ncbi:glucose 1-dehydrogenase [Rhodocytophaga rosea]|uniref:Glucose 1-dehydrogenase n=1 Tax=Rhodocytophaga rosea TaxID=2704465 RepID=A0A6C0GQA4_9BACT|nr:glucose 1-dehydrogenase [Rhodocytophaga rosea]QHT70107.1 glucose 1-dehydrogenase [Rhodocytophaga rosea]
MSFENKVALITGGASGIGKATAHTFAEKGVHVMIADIMEDAGFLLARELKAKGVKAGFVKVDVCQASEVENMVDITFNTFGRLDFCVNSAGIEGSRTRIDQYPEASFEQVMDVNVTGLWRCMKAQLPFLMKGQSGCIVNIASVAGLKGFPGHCAYAASKHAVIGLTKTAAMEFVRYNIRINAVCPGFTDTPMVEQVLQTDPAYMDKILKSIPMRRLANAREIADMVVYLCSAQATFITGQAFAVDGGITAM